MPGPSVAATRTPAQQLFVDNVLGILVYAVVLGFYDDYTDLVDVTSASTVFLAAIVLQALTWGTFQVKDAVVARLRGPSAGHRVAMALGVWLVMFTSKFVFVEVVDLLFGDDVRLSSFWAVLAVVATVTVVGGALTWVHRRLGTEPA